MCNVPPPPHLVKKKTAFPQQERIQFSSIQFYLYSAFYNENVSLGACL